MKNKPLEQVQRTLRGFGIASKHLGWIVAAVLLVYFNSGLRAYADTAPATLEWNTVLKHFQIDSDKFIGQQFLFECPERTVRDRDATLYGTDVYPSDSPLCVAAVHAGVITPAGGLVRVQLNPGVENYIGSKQYDIQSGDFPQTQRSIVFMADQFAGTLNSIQQDYAPRLKWDTKFTSTGLANMKLVGQQFLFRCPSAPSNLAGRRVYGTDRYAFNSYVCLAAVHAGRLTKEGGFVTVQMIQPQDKLKGSIRNGVESKDGAKGTRQLVFPVTQLTVAVN